MRQRRTAQKEGSNDRVRVSGDRKNGVETVEEVERKHGSPRRCYEGKKR